MPPPRNLSESARTAARPCSALAALLIMAACGGAEQPRSLSSPSELAALQADVADSVAADLAERQRRQRAADQPGAPSSRPDGSVELVIHAVGDCAIGDLHHGAGAPGSFAAQLSATSDPMGYPFAAVATLFHDDDLTIANLEGVLTESRSYHNPVFSIRGEPAYAQMLVRGGVELVDLDNNHSDDYGVQGLSDTKAALAAAGVEHFGKGRIDERVISGVRVTNLGYLGGNGAVEPRVRREVAAARARGGVVIASFHWGIEGYYAIHPLQRRLGRAAIDAGADLVLGHHPHVIQGIERYHGRHIVYSLGNFVFGANSQPKDTDSMIAKNRFVVRDKQVILRELTLIPVTISGSRAQNDFRPQPLIGSDAERVLAKVDKMSKALQSANGG